MPEYLTPFEKVWDALNGPHGDNATLYAQTAALVRDAKFPEPRQFAGQVMVRFLDRCQELHIPPPHYDIGMQMLAATAALFAAERLNDLPPNPALYGHHGDNAILGQIRDLLLRQQVKALEPTATLDALANALAASFVAVTRHLPNIAQGNEVEGDTPASDAPTIPLIDLLPNVAPIIEEMLEPFDSPEVRQFGLFRWLHDKCKVNTDRLAEGSRASRPLAPTQHKGSPAEIVEAYLGSTMLDAIFLESRVPFIVPEGVRFEHTHIIGGAGWGKSTLIAQTILDDLAQPNPPAIIVIDPHGTLIDEIEHLAIFDPTDPTSLAEKLVIVDPRDSAAPPALNMFDAASKRSKLYSDDVRNEVENNTISLYQYIFGSIASALTQKQTTAFSFVVRLLFTIPGATIHTLLELMEDGAKRLEDSPFRPHIEALESVTARRFFEHHFFHPTEFRETRQQIAHRLYGLLQHADFERMFATPERKLDMFECMQSGSIVLVHAARGRLGKEASQLFGRYIIALTFAAAFERLSVPQSQWNPAYLIVDEAADFFDEQIETMLDSVRKFRLGLTFAHQRIEGQVSEAMRSALSANTSIKYAGGVGARDAAFMAKDMACDPAFIIGQRKTASATNFACYVRGYTARAVSLSVPLGVLGKQPKMTEAAHRLLRAANAQRLRSTAPAQPQPAQPRPKPPPAVTEGTAASPPRPAATDPDTGSHTDAATKWGA
jgi:hypothetical protein